MSVCLQLVHLMDNLHSPRQEYLAYFGQLSKPSDELRWLIAPKPIDYFQSVLLLDQIPPAVIELSIGEIYIPATVIPSIRTVGESVP